MYSKNLIGLNPALEILFQYEGHLPTPESTYLDFLDSFYFFATPTSVVLFRIFVTSNPHYSINYNLTDPNTCF